jgi:hypothetical protein
MSPWEEAEHFDLPAPTIVTVANGTQQLVKANPQRVGLIVTNFCSAVVFLNPVFQAPSSNPSKGWPCINYAPPLVLLQSQLGVLVQCQWWANNTFAASCDLQVIELVMKDWPAASQNGVSKWVNSWLSSLPFSSTVLSPTSGTASDLVAKTSAFGWVRWLRNVLRSRQPEPGK